MEELKEEKNTNQQVRSSTGKALAFSFAVWVGYIVIVLIILLVFFRI